MVAGPWSVSTPLRTSPTVRILAGLSPIANLADISVAGVDRTIATEGITPQVTTAAYSIQQFTSSSRSTHLGEYRHACTARLETVSRTTRTYQAACIPPSHHADNKNQGLHSTVFFNIQWKVLIIPLEFFYFYFCPDIKGRVPAAPLCYSYVSPQFETRWSTHMASMIEGQ